MECHLYFTAEKPLSAYTSEAREHERVDSCTVDTAIIKLPEIDHLLRIIVGIDSAQAQ